MDRRRITVARLAAAATLLVVVFSLASCPNPAGTELRTTVSEYLDSQLPDIRLSIGGETYATGSEYDFGAVLTGTTEELTITIANIGPNPLILSGSPAVAVQHQLRSGFSTLSQPSTEIGSGDTATFRVGFAPTEIAAYISRLSIASNDENETPYLMTLQGRGVGEGTILYPDGGEVLRLNETYEIQWTPFGGGGTVDLDLYFDGALQSAIVSTEDDGIYSWTIPGGTAQGSLYRVRVTSNSSSGFDESDGDFAIGDISTVALSGSGIYTTGDAPDISWVSGMGGTVSIDLYRDGALDQGITSATANDGSYSWTIPVLTDSAAYNVRVTSTANDEIYADSSLFAVGTISNVEPSGGAYEPGGSYEVTWDSVVGGTVNIALYQAASPVQTIATGTDNDGSYSSWSVPALPGAGYTIRVTSVQNGLIVAESAETFVIGTITVSAPIANAPLLRGLGATAEWSSSIGGYVNIDLYKSGVYVSRLANNTPNATPFSYDLSLNAGLAIDEDYRIRVSSSWNPNLYGESDAFWIGGWVDYGAAIPAVSATIGTDDCDLVIDYYGTPRVIGSYGGGKTMFTYESGQGDDAVWSASNVLTNMMNDERVALSVDSNSPISDVHAYYISDGTVLTASIQDPASAPLWDSTVTVRAEPARHRFAVTQQSNPVALVYELYSDLVAYRWTGTSYADRGTLFDYDAHSGPSFSSYYPAVAAGPDDHPVAVFRTRDVSGYPYTVMRWESGTTWTAMPSPTAATDSSSIQIVVDGSNLPVLVFLDPIDYRVRVLRYDGTSSWDDLGYASDGWSTFPQIVVDGDDVPVVSYTSGSGPLVGHVLVKRYVSGASEDAIWEDLGHRGIDLSPDVMLRGSSALATDPDGNPAIAYTEWPDGGNDCYIRVQIFQSH